MLKENNHYIKDCPFLLPDENLKMFTELLKHSAILQFPDTYANQYKHKK